MCRVVVIACAAAVGVANAADSELGWTPVEWLRVGMIGQRSNTVDTGRELQRGAFVQVAFERLRFGVCFFNPDSAARYVIGSLGLKF